MPPDDFSPVELDRHLAGDAPAESEALVREWASADPAHRATLESVRAIRQTFANSPTWDVGAMWARFARDNMGVPPVVPRLARRFPITTPHRNVFGGFAGALGVALVALFGFVFTRGASKSDTSTAVTEYRTAVGQRASVTLHDGSRVTLAPQSILRVNKSFGSASRQVSLNGEAYFDVSHASGVPFVVATGNVHTRVLGTAFNVRRYLNDSAVRVSVTQGKVVLETNASRISPLTLTAGAIGVMSDTSAGTILTDDAARDAAWIQGRLAFREARTPEVLAALTRWYGYSFQLADSSLARERLTVWISTESAAAALATLKLALDVDLTFNANVVTLRRHGTAGAPTRRPPHDLITPINKGVGR